MRPDHHCLNCITPPHLLRKLLDSHDKEARQAALSTLLTTERLRGERAVRALFFGAANPGNGRRTIFDCRNGTFLPSRSWRARRMARPRPMPRSIGRSTVSGLTRNFYNQVLQRNSIDDLGMRLDAYVHSPHRLQQRVLERSVDGVR